MCCCGVTSLFVEGSRQDGAACEGAEEEERESCGGGLRECAEDQVLRIVGEEEEEAMEAAPLGEGIT